MNEQTFNPAFNLAGQIALITGGGTGLGLGMARCFVAAGAKVVLVGRRTEELEKACVALGKNAFALAGDVTKLESAPASLFTHRNDLLSIVTIKLFGCIHLRRDPPAVPCP